MAMKAQLPSLVLGQALVPFSVLVYCLNTTCAARIRKQRLLASESNEDISNVPSASVGSESTYSISRKLLPMATEQEQPNMIHGQASCDGGGQGTDTKSDSDSTTPDNSITSDNSLHHNSNSRGDFSVETSEPHLAMETPSVELRLHRTPGTPDRQMSQGSPSPSDSNQTKLMPSRLGPKLYWSRLSLDEAYPIIIHSVNLLFFVANQPRPRQTISCWQTVSMVLDMQVLKGVACVALQHHIASIDPYIVFDRSQWMIEVHKVIVGGGEHTLRNCDNLMDVIPHIMKHPCEPPTFHVKVIGPRHSGEVRLDSLGIDRGNWKRLSGVEVA